jgi:hypothetical protein
MFASISRSRKSTACRACPDGGKSHKRDTNGLQHIRTLLVNERRRIETQRLQSFKEMGAALQKLAKDEQEFLKLVATPRPATTAEECPDEAGDREERSGSSSSYANDGILNRIDT